MEMYEAMTRVTAMAQAYKAAAGQPVEGADLEALEMVTAAAVKGIPYTPLPVLMPWGARAYECKCGAKTYVKTARRCPQCGQAWKW